MALQYRDIGDIPSAPGVYLFYSKGQIVYVGKSKHLKERVRSYFGKIHEREKLYQMMRYVDDLRYIVTDSHLEARLLEYELIRKHTPIYNTRHTRRRGNAYLYVDEKKLLAIGTSGFGPILNTKGLKIFIRSMESLYPICQTGNDFLFKKQIITKKLTDEEREATASALRSILYDKKSRALFCGDLSRKMKAAAGAMAFEEANFYKELLESVEYHIDRTEREHAFYEKPYIFLTEKKDRFILTCGGRILIKDSIEKLPQYEGYDYSNVTMNPDLEYAKIIYSEAKSEGFVGEKYSAETSL